MTLSWFIFINIPGTKTIFYWNTETEINAYRFSWKPKINLILFNFLSDQMHLFVFCILGLSGCDFVRRLDDWSDFYRSPCVAMVTHMILYFKTLWWWQYKSSIQINTSCSTLSSSSSINCESGLMLMCWETSVTQPQT